MSVTAYDGEARKVGGCSACNDHVLTEPPWTYGTVRVITLQPGAQGGTQIRLCSSCRAELRKALA